MPRFVNAPAHSKHNEVHKIHVQMRFLYFDFVNQFFELNLGQKSLQQHNY